ncbi:unnamed protein product, partial [Phaeothamnion confervicola]
MVFLSETTFRRTRRRMESSTPRRSPSIPPASASPCRWSLASSCFSLASASAAGAKGGCDWSECEEDVAMGKYAERPNFDLLDKTPRHRKILWIFSVLFMLAYMACAGAAYRAAADSQETVDSAFTGTVVFLENVEDAICAQDGNSTCTEGSLGRFIEDAADYGNQVFDEVVAAAEFITSDLIDKASVFNETVELMSNALDAEKAALDAFTNATEAASASLATVNGLPGSSGLTVV